MATMDHNKKQVSFEAWLFVETYNISFLIFANLIYLLFRNLRRPALGFEIEGTSDHTADFLGCDDTNQVMSILGTITSLIGTNLLLYNSATIVNETTEASIQSLHVNLYMQIVQAICYIFLMYVPTDGGRLFPGLRTLFMKLHWTLVHILFLVVPIISIGYWFVRI